MPAFAMPLLIEVLLLLLLFDFVAAAIRRPNAIRSVLEGFPKTHNQIHSQLVYWNYYCCTVRA